jgi:hypothetical protein
MTTPTSLPDALVDIAKNVAGLYATLLSDAQIALPSLAEIGYTGASGRCPHAASLPRNCQPESVILFRSC